MDAAGVEPSPSRPGSAGWPCFSSRRTCPWLGGGVGVRVHARLALLTPHRHCFEQAPGPAPPPPLGSPPALRQRPLQPLPGPAPPPPGPGALNRCRAPRGHSGRARGGGSSCAVIRPGTKARPPVLGQVNTRFVMEMSAGQPEQMIRGLGKRRPLPGAGEGSGAGGGDPSSAPGPPAEHATRPFSCKSAHAFATSCRPAASTRRPAPAEPGCPPCAAPRQPNQTRQPRGLGTVPPLRATAAGRTQKKGYPTRRDPAPQGRPPSHSRGLQRPACA